MYIEDAEIDDADTVADGERIAYLYEDGEVMRY